MLVIFVTLGAVALNVSFLRFYPERCLFGYDKFSAVDDGRDVRKNLPFIDGCDSSTALPSSNAAKSNVPG